MTATGTCVVSFASNDYLGLSQHPRVVDAAHAALDRWGAGAGAARLVVGSRPVHHDLEDDLAAWRGTEAAVLFPTGFAANLGVLSSLAAPGVRICSDELNHASIIDGCRLARANGARCGSTPTATSTPSTPSSAHRGRNAPSSSPTWSSRWTATSPISGGIGERCHRHGSMLVIDEAHAVLQPRPPDDLAPVVLTVGTLSKTLGSLGGFVAGPRPFTDLLVNRARSYIFTTAASPADAAAALAAVAHRRLSPRATCCGLGCGTTSNGSLPATSPRSCRWSSATRALRRRLGAPARRGPARPGHPPPHRRPRDQPATHRPVRRPHRRPGRSPAHRAGRPGATGHRPGDRPMRTVAVVGTGTEVGKTWVGAHALPRAAGPRLRGGCAQAGAVVRPRRPHDRRPRAGPRHGRGTERRVPPTPLVPDPHGATDGGRCARAPPVHDRRPGGGDDLARPPPAVGLVETAGGVRSPHAADGDAITLIEAIQPDIVVLVGDAGLGTLNAVRLSLEALDRGAHVATPIVFLNRFDAADDLHRRNKGWLDEHVPAEVVVTISSLVRRLRPA